MLISHDYCRTLFLTRCSKPSDIGKTSDMSGCSTDVQKHYIGQSVLFLRIDFRKHGFRSID